MEKAREKDLLKRAMEATHSSMSMEKKKPQCEDIESTVYGELEKAHEWLQHPHHRTVIKEGIPVFQAIEKIRDYIGRTDIPQWEVKEFMAKIDLLLTEWASKRSAATGEDLRSILEKFHVHDEETKCSCNKCHCHGKRHVEVTDDQDEVEPNVAVKYEPADVSEKQKKAMDRINEELKKLTDNKSSMRKNSIGYNIDHDLSDLPDNRDRMSKEDIEKAEGYFNRVGDPDLREKLIRLYLNGLECRQRLDKAIDEYNSTAVTKATPATNDPKSSVRNHNVGCSNYSKHKIQPWDIWEEYKLNPWDADIVKRVLREKEDGRPATVTRIEDYDKIIHVCQERIRQIQANGHV